MLIMVILLDAFSEKPVDAITYESPNLAHLIRFVEELNVLHHYPPIPVPRSSTRCRCGRGRSTRDTTSHSRIFTTVQIMCMPMLLRPGKDIGLVTLGFNTSQTIAYGTPEAYPILHGPCNLDVNMDYILHNINFWKHHMLRASENTLYRAFTALPEDKRPRWWDTQLKQGVSHLGKNWKGCYAYIGRDDITYLRQNGEDEVIDCFGGEEGAYEFQDLTLNLISNPGLYFTQTAISELTQYIPDGRQGVLRTGILPTTAAGQPINPNPVLIQYLVSLASAGVTDEQAISILLSSSFYFDRISYYKGIYRSPGIRN